MWPVWQSVSHLSFKLTFYFLVSIHSKSIHLLTKDCYCYIFQLDLVDFENNPELKKLQFLAPGPKMAGLTKGNSLSKKEGNIKEGRRCYIHLINFVLNIFLYLQCFE